MRHLFPVVMAFQAFGKEMSNRSMRAGLASKKLVEGVNNQISKNPGLMGLIRPLILLLLNNIQLCEHRNELRCSDESLSFHCREELERRIPGPEDGRSGTYTRLTARVARIPDRSMKPKTTKLYQRA